MPDPTTTISKFADEIAARQYYQDGEDFDGMLRRVAKHIARAEAIDAYKADNGRYPEWYLSFEGRRRNLLDLNTLDAWIEKEGYAEVCEEWETKFLKLMRAKKFFPGGRILAGSASTYGQLQNCFVLGPNGRYIGSAKEDPDSIDGIYELSYKLAKVTKTGGGCGISLNFMRESHSVVQGSQGTSSGPVSFLRHNFNSTLKVIKQGGVRRGAGMATMRIDHPDVLDFITAKDTDREETEGKIEAFNISLLITDDFMERVRNDKPALFKSIHTGKWILPNAVPGKYQHPGHTSVGEHKVIPHVYDSDTGAVGVPATWLWEEIIKHAWLTGEPGILFVDRINQYWPFREVLGEIEATNPCVTADTWVDTSSGPRQVHELVGVPFEVLVNGEVAPSTLEGFYSTGKKEVWELLLADGRTLSLTEDHPVLVVTNQTRYSQSTEWKKAKDIKENDLVVITNHRDLSCTGWAGWAGEGDFDEGYLMGLLFGDGTLGNRPTLYAWGEDSEGIRNEAYWAHSNSIRSRNDWTGWHHKEYTDSGIEVFQMRSSGLRDMTRKYGLVEAKVIGPNIEKASYDFYQGFLRGLFDADGSVQGTTDKGISIRLAQSDVVALEAVQRMLSRMGINSSIYLRRTVEQSEWATKDQYELVISNDNLRVFNQEIGFSDTAKQQKLEDKLSGYSRTINRERFVGKVLYCQQSYTEDGPRIETVYDCTIPGVHAFSANGITVHNCGEEPLWPGESCCLGSIVLHNYVTDEGFDFLALEDDMHTMLRFLDNVVTINVHPLADTQEWCDRLRRVGLGVMGDAVAMMKLGLGYSTPESLDMRKRIADTIRDSSLRVSEFLAEEKGAFPLSDKLPEGIKPRRNVHMLSIAPTGTISMVCDTSSGIEPVFALAMQRRVGTEYKFRLDPTFEAYLREHRTDINLDNELEFVPLDTAVGTDNKGKEIRDKIMVPKIIKDIMENHGSIEGLVEFEEENTRNMFETAHDVSPADHVKVQGVWQKTLDSPSMAMASISKTVNLANDATIEDVRNVYDLGFREGLKGVTIYRDGSRDIQVLTTAVKKAEVEAKVVTTPEIIHVEVPSIITRPSKTNGGMVKAEFLDPHNNSRKVYIYIGCDDLGYPVEVFITDEDGEVDVHPYAAALGKMISLALKHGATPHKIANKLRKITGGSVCYNGGIFQSVPAKVGQLLEEAVLEMETMLEEDMELDSPGEIVCRHRMINQGGCRVCELCGYSKCG